MNISEVSSILKHGGVALLPTDTVYGLAADPANPIAVQKIFELKSRPTEKNLPILAANAGQIKKLGARIDGRIQKLLDSKWIPGPLTLILEIEPESAPDWLEHREEIAIRIPDNTFLLSLLALTGPLHATSANKSGMDPAEDVASVLRQLSGAPDVTVDGGPCSGASSTIINCQTNPFSVQRRGALSSGDLSEILSI